jgi:predicted nucleic acid-binding protein
MSDRYWDSGCFLALFNNEIGRIDNCKSVLMAAERGDLRVITSALTLTEVIKIKGSKSLPPEQEDTIRAFFEHEWIVVRDVDRFIAEQARDFIWKHKLAPYDAIHLATAYKHKLQHLDAYDTDLTKLNGKIGSPPMAIGEPPVIPYQTELPAIEPGSKKAPKKLSAKIKKTKPRPAK